MKIKHITTIFTALILVGILGTRSTAAPEWYDKVDTWVFNEAATGETEFLVYLNEQADLRIAASLAAKEDKGQFVYEKLTSTANRSQSPIINRLKLIGAEFQPFWIANMIWVRGDLDTVETLAKRSDVHHIYANPTIHQNLPELSVQTTVPTWKHQESDTEGSQESIEWNIQLVNAPQVWNDGYQGQEIVIGGQDTGYDWDHPALMSQYRGINGDIIDHNYNWHDAIHEGGGSCGADSPEPCDDHGHGTHTLGTMVGDDGDQHQIGMAPKARWIGCRNMNVGAGSPATYSECYQWFLAPTDLNGENPRPDLAPDIINNSWSCPESEGCTDPNILLTIVDNLRAAGIMTVHSAGNTGPLCSSVNTPAAIYDGSFTVGATDSVDNIASFSSRGPVLVDGSSRLKPDISAPGVSIYSSRNGGGYGSSSGTSMASPHVAGLAALILSANPNLRGEVDIIEDIITQTAVPRTADQDCGNIPGEQVPNNTYGWGRINAWDAYLFSQEHILNVTKTPNRLVVEPGGELTYKFSISHLHPITLTTGVVLSDQLPLGTSIISATMPHTISNDLIQWDLGILESGETMTAELSLRVSENMSGTITNETYWVISNESNMPSYGEAVSTPVRYLNYLLSILNSFTPSEQ